MRQRRISAVIVLVLAAVVTASSASAQTMQPAVPLEELAAGHTIDQDVTREQLDALFKCSPAQSTCMKEFANALTAIVPFKSFSDLLGDSLESEPIVLFLSVGSSRRVFLLRKDYRGVWLEPNERRLGRITDFWVVYVADRATEVRHSIVVQERPTREFELRSDYDFGSSNTGIPAGSDRSLSIGVKRFHVVHRPSSQLVTLRTFDLLSSQSYTEEVLLGAYSTRPITFDVGLMAPLVRSIEDAPRVFLVGTMGFGAIRERARAGNFSKSSFGESILWLYPNFVLGFNVPNTGLDDATYYEGLEWPVRGSPLGINIGLMFTKRTVPDVLGTRQMWTFNAAAGISFAIGRAINLMSGR